MHNRNIYYLNNEAHVGRLCGYDSLKVTLSSSVNAVMNSDDPVLRSVEYSSDSEEEESTKLMIDTDL